MALVVDEEALLVVIFEEEVEWDWDIVLSLFSTIRFEFEEIMNIAYCLIWLWWYETLPFTNAPCIREENGSSFLKEKNNVNRENS